MLSHTVLKTEHNLTMAKMYAQMFQSWALMN